MILLTPYGKNDKFSEWSWMEKLGDEQRVEFNIEMNKLVNFSVVLNPFETGNRTNSKNENYEGYKLSLYTNGNITKYSYLNKEIWTDFVEICKKTATDTFFLGTHRCGTTGKGNYTAYGEMVLKNCRFYARALDDAEIKLNYDTRLAYDEINN